MLGELSGGVATLIVGLFAGIGFIWKLYGDVRLLKMLSKLQAERIDKLEAKTSDLEQKIFDNISKILHEMSTTREAIARIEERIAHGSVS